MRFFETTLLVSLIVIWIAVFFKYETIAFLSRSRSRDEATESADNRHRTRKALSDMYHRAADKISDKLRSRSRRKEDQPKPIPNSNTSPLPNPNPNPAAPPPSPNTVKPKSIDNNNPKPADPYVPSINSKNHDKIGNKLKIGEGLLMLSGLAKKIKTSGRHRGSHHNYHSGLYHNYNYRPERYGYIMGDTCVNNINYDGIIFGQFICPIEGFDYTASKCCGNIYEQYCCTPAEAYDYNPSDTHSYFEENYEQTIAKKSGNPAIVYALIAIIVCFLIALIAIAVAIVIYFKKIKK